MRADKCCGPHGEIRLIIRIRSCVVAPCRSIDSLILYEIHIHHWMRYHPIESEAIDPTQCCSRDWESQVERIRSVSETFVDCRVNNYRDTDVSRAVRYERRFLHDHQPPSRWIIKDA